MGQGIGGFFQIRQIRAFFQIPGLVSRQRHTHGRCGIGAAALGDHIRNGLGYLLMTAADHGFHTDGIDPPVQNLNGPIFIPGDIFIPQQKCQAFISSKHTFSSCQIFAATPRRAVI